MHCKAFRGKWLSASQTVNLKHRGGATIDRTELCKHAANYVPFVTSTWGTKMHCWSS